MVKNDHYRHGTRLPLLLHSNVLAHQLLQKSEAAVIIINEECLMTERVCSVNEQEFQFLAEICAKKIPSDTSQIWGLSIPNIFTVI